MLALARMLMGADAPVQLAPADSRRRERRVGRCVPAERRPAYAPGTHGRDRQHRCRRAAGARPTRWPKRTDEQPALLVDLATLTGAARVALGPELPAIYSDAAGTRRAAAAPSASAMPTRCGPCRCGAATTRISRAALPTSTMCPHDAFAGSIIGALFLERFVTRTRNWLHVRCLRLEPKERPGQAGRRRTADRARAVPADRGSAYALGALSPAADRRWSCLSPRDRAWALVGLTPRPGRGRDRGGADQGVFARRRTRGSGQSRRRASSAARRRCRTW